MATGVDMHSNNNNTQGITGCHRAGAATAIRRIIITKTWTNYPDLQAAVDEAS